VPHLQYNINDGTRAYSQRSSALGAGRRHVTVCHRFRCNINRGRLHTTKTDPPQKKYQFRISPSARWFLIAAESMVEMVQ
jgi:hypothetical protein